MEKKTQSSTEPKKTTTRKSKSKNLETKPVEDQVNEILEEPKNESVTSPQINEQPKPIGSLFNVINYHNVADLDRFIQNLTPDQALYCVVQAAKAGHQRNVFNIEESELVSKAIRVLTTPPQTEKPNNVPDPEIHKA